MKKLYFSFLLCCIQYAAFALSNLGGGSIGSGTACYPTTNYAIQNFQINQSTVSATLTSLSFTTSGTYVGGDISNYYLLYNTVNNLGTATLLGTLPSAGPGAMTFSGLAGTLTAGTTYYLWITVDVPGTATSGHSIAVSSIGSGSITVSTGGTSGVATAGGSQTLSPTPSAITSSTGIDYLCTGLCTTLNATPAGGIFSTTSSGIVSITGSNVCGAVTGTALVSYTIGGACSSTVALTVSATTAPAITPALPINICIAQDTTLSDPYPSGTWSTTSGNISVNATTGVVAGLSAGTGTVTYTVGSCTATKSISVGAVVPAIVGSNDSVCSFAENTITLTDPDPSGIWSSTGVTVTSGVGNIGIVNAPGGPGSSGNCVTYTLPSGCSATICFDVEPWPAAITGRDTLCADMYDTLSDASGGGKWSSSLTGVATIDSLHGWVTGTGAGSTTITYTSSTTHCYNVRPLYVYSFGPIIAPPSICVFTPTFVADTASGGVWSTGPSAVGSISAVGTTGDTVSLTGLTPGLDTLYYSIGGHGCHTWDTVRVYSAPVAIGGPLFVCAGTTNSLTDGTAGGHWFSSNPGVVGIDSVSGVDTAKTAGTALITYRVGTTTCFVTATVTVNALPGAISGGTQFCVAAHDTLTELTVGGSWTLTNGHASIATTGLTTCILTGVSGGTDTVFFTTAAGCSSMYIVTVNPLPAAISGTLAICAGDISSLTDAGGGAWTAYATSVGTIDPAFGLFTGLAAGTDSVVYTLLTGCAVHAIVTVNPLPSAITGTMSMCVGQSTTLSDPSSGTWFSFHTGIATVTSGGVVLGVGAGIDTIQYTTGTGCYVYAVVTVNALPNPIAGATFSVCTGYTISLTDIDTGGIWTTATSTIDSVSGGIVTGFATTISTGTITYTLPTGCSTTHNVTVYPVPGAISGSGIVCFGTSVDFSDPTFGGSWLSSNSLIASVGGLTGVVTGVDTGTAIISYTAPDGCFVVFPVTVDPTPGPIGAGSNTVCQSGTPISVWDSTLGGSWSPTAVGSYPISVTDLGVVGVTDQGSLSGINGGTGLVTYTLPGTGCYTTLAITVLPAPQWFTASGVTQFCPGDTIVILDSVVGGTWITSPIVTTFIRYDSSLLVDSLILRAGPGGLDNIGYFMPNGCHVFQNVEVNLAPDSIVATTTTVCQGQTISLSDASGGGSWTASNGSLVTLSGGVPVTGVTGSTTLTGVDTISYSFPIVSGALAACGVSITVTVNPLTPITGILSVCEGGTTTLNDANPVTGIWGSEYTGIATVTPLLIDPTTGVVSAGLTTPGVDSISYSVTTSGATCIAYAAVTVNPLPTAITGGNNVCIGTTLTLSEPTGSTGSWSLSVPGLATITSSSGDTCVLTGVTSGTVTVTYTLPGTGCYMTQLITVNPAPDTIAGPTEICPGTTVSYSDADGGTWLSSSSGLIIGSTTGLAIGVTGGTYIITNTSPFGCAATLAVNVVTMDSIELSPPTTLPLNVCVGSTILLTDGTAGGSWSSSDNAIATIDPSGYVTGVHDGTVTISYSLTTGCFMLESVNVNPIGPILGHDTICQYLTTIWTDSVSGGLWSSDDNTIASVTSTGVVTGVNPGIVLIHYVLATGCTASETVDVVGIGAITQASLLSSVCTGTTLNLADTSTPSLPDPWSISATSVATVNASGVVTGEGSGTAIVTFTASWGFAGAHCIAEYPITVNSSPTPILGLDSLCAWGGTVTLADTTVGGVWSSTTATVGPVFGDSAVVFGAGPPSGMITYSLPTGCFVTKFVTVNPLPLPIVGSTTLCWGHSETLTDPTGGGTWVSGNPTVDSITSGGVLYGNDSGIATISYVLGTGCLVTFTDTVNIDSPIVGPNSVCSGFDSLFHNGITGGAWSASPTGIVTFTPTTGTSGSNVFATASVTVPTVVTIIYTLPGAGGCAMTKVVTFNPNPVAITYLTNVICGLDSMLFSDASGGGTWSTSDSGVATVANTGFVLGTWEGTGDRSGTITYTLPTGCFATAPVTVHPMGPIVPAATVLCTGVATTFFDTVGGGTWTASNTAIVTMTALGTNQEIITGISSVFPETITYTSPAGCFTTLTVTIDPTPDPITGPMAVCVGSTITLSDDLLIGTGTWSVSNGDASLTGTVITGGLSNVGVAGENAGVDNVTYTVPTGCSVSYYVTVNPLPAHIVGPNTVCGTDSVTLTDSLGTFGTWAISPTSIVTINPVTGQVNAYGGTAGGIATVTYSIPPMGCSVYLTITVNPLSDIVGPDHICTGVPTLFTDGTPLGVWSSTSTTIATIGSGTGVATGHITGPDTIKYTMASGCVAYELVSVNPTPGPIDLPPYVCVGQTVTATDATFGGVWTSHATAIATIDPVSGVIGGESSGTVIISYSFGTGCYAVSTIIVDPLSPIVGPTQVCYGTSIFLTDATPGGTWSSTFPSIASVALSATFPEYTGDVYGVSTTGGLDTIKYTMSTGCVATLLVTENPLPAPIVAPSNLCLHDTVSISDASPAFGKWTISPTTTADTIFNPISPITSFVGRTVGAVTLKYEDTLTGCFVTKLINVNQLPDSMTGLFNVCLDATTTLYDATIVPPPPSGDGIWVTTGGIVTELGAGYGYAVFEGIAVGTTTISYYTPGGCLMTHLLEVSPNVTPTIDIYPNIGDTVSVPGHDIICTGQSVNFDFGTTFGGITPTYQWSVNGTIVSTGASYSYTPATGDLVKVVMTSDVVCPTNPFANDQWIMTVDPVVADAVAISPTTLATVCSGNPVTLIATGTNGGPSPTYTWYVNGVSVAAGPVYTYDPVNGDIITCDMTSSLHCAMPAPAVSNSVTATVNPTLVDAVTIFAYPGTTVNAFTSVFFNLEAINYGFAATYQWYDNGVLIPGATSDTFTLTNPQNNDVITCVMTSSNPCTTPSITTSNGLKMIIGNVGVAGVPNAFSEVALVPNPNKGTFALKGTMNDVASGEVGVEITDVVGRVVYHGTTMAVNGKVDMQIGLDDNVVNGVYYLRISAEGVSDVRHFVIER